MSFQDSYAFLDDWVIQALRGLGIDATYKPLNDITSPSGKIGGAAQKRLGSGSLLHHVTMSYDMDGDKMVTELTWHAWLMLYIVTGSLNCGDG